MIEKLQNFCNEKIHEEKEELKETKKVPNGHNSFAAGMSAGAIAAYRNVLSVLTDEEVQQLVDAMENEK